MRSAFATLALAALAAANPMPQGVTSAIAPKTSPPAGCSENYDGTFEIQVMNMTSSGKRDLQRRDAPLTITLKGGVLTDSQGRTGYIAANQQFQFDDPPQTGAIYTAGFSVCGNGSLAIGGDAVWYKCLSGTFYNLYDENNAAQCSPIYIMAVGAGSSGSSGPASASAVATEQPDGQPTATPVAGCSEYVDGQPQCSAAPTPACSEYKDGQPQCSSAAPTPACSEYKDGQPQCSSAAPSPACSEYVDGQPQCSSAAPAPTAECSEYVDGQPQCSSAAPAPTAECSEYVDGQPQCSSAAPAPTAECSEYVDGQPQCSSAAPAPVTTSAAAECSEYVDGQPQCASATPAPACSEYVDGQPQCSAAATSAPAGTGTYYKPTGTGAYAPSSYTGPAIATGNAAAPTGIIHREVFGLAAGVLAVALL